MHENLEQFDAFGLPIYAVSIDKPEELKRLSDVIKEEFPRNDEREITFLSDPDLKLIDYMDMKNGDIAFRGFGILNKDGKVVFVHKNDYWGQELDKTLEIIEKEYK